VTNSLKLWYTFAPWISTKCTPHHTPATLPKAFHKEPGLMLSRGPQNMWRRLWQTPQVY